MAKRCMRPGCDRTAAARLTYDPVACELWLDPVTPGSRAAVQELCEFHVERLTVPRGWVATDRRVPTETPEPPPTRPARPVRSVVEAPAPVVEAPAPDPVVEAPVPDPVVEASAPDPVVEASAPAAGAAPDLLTEPSASASDGAQPEAAPDPTAEAGAPDPDPAPSGGASLLARAFAWTGPQHSVLTTPAAAADSEDAPTRE